MTRSSKLVACAYAFALVLASGSAVAAPSPADVESARSLYVRGKETRDERNYEASLEHFKGAHALVPTPITALELARAHALLAQLLEARAVLSTIERMPVVADESKKAAASRTEARELATELGILIPSLDIRVAHTPDAEPEVTVDGERVPPEALGVPRKVNPGAHVIVARIGDAERTENVIVKEREVKAVSFDLRGASTATRVTETKPMATATRGSGFPWLTVTLGVAGTAGALSAGSGIFALSKKGTLDDLCVAGLCPPEAHDDLSALQTSSTLATVALGVAIVAVGTSTVIWLLQRDPAKTASAGPSVVTW